jgi:hypothetical protein
MDDQSLLIAGDIRGIPGLFFSRQQMTGNRKQKGQQASFHDSPLTAEAIATPAAGYAF